MGAGGRGRQTVYYRLEGHEVMALMATLHEVFCERAGAPAKARPASAKLKAA